MLTAFALVIVFGIGGMVSFFWLAIKASSSTDTAADWITTPAGITWMRNAAAAQFAAYYQRQGSWKGVEHEWQSFAVPGSANYTYIIVDRNDRVVATSRADVLVGRPLTFALTDEGTPIIGKEGQVGTIFLVSDRPLPAERMTVPAAEPAAMPMMGTRGMPRDAAPFGKAIFSAGLALAAVLLGLAAFFSRRISNPLLHMTEAAKQLAAGNLEARVRAYRVREIDELARAFNQMADSLARADQQRRQMTADVAHELRTPLSIIKGRLEGIQDGVYEASPDQIVGLLEETALLERLVEDLRLLALAEAGQLPLYTELVEPAHLIADVARSFDHQAHERRVALLVETAAELPDIQADPQRMVQVLGNLVSNALRYTPVGGQVTLRAYVQQTAPTTPTRNGNALTDTSSAMICFEVQDTGSGIAPADLPYIFDRFYRADRSRTRSSGGAGLGLAITRRIVEAHGGTMSAHSTVGAGTTISFSLPIEHLPNLAVRDIVPALTS